MAKENRMYHGVFLKTCKDFRKYKQKNAGF